ncbi:MAG: molybdopterin molybdotransferase MoeA [Woeseiaceae bacterium]|nr:molybdopterin molybdotransferase MoeA [Woeseiaceae bacterium]
MLASSEARQQIFATMQTFGTERVDLARAAGRILRESVRAERDQPPFDRVTMDGIAVRRDAVEAGRRSFAVRGRCHAGDESAPLDDPDGCMEVMTGAVLPPGTDCVIPVERLRVADGAAELEPGYAPEAGQFVHRRGSDHAADTLLINEGARIAPVDVAVIASCGMQTVEVAARPVLRLLSTGNELVAAGRPIAAHQIRLSNGPAIAAMLGAEGFVGTTQEHLRDDPDALEQRIGAHLQEADVLVLSGGVSMGKADFVPAILDGLGVKKVFHKVAQRPGKPLWFGRGPRGQSVFALPGNPVSSIVCCRQYLLPALIHASGGQPREAVAVRLAEALDFAPQLTCFLPVRLVHGDDAVVDAVPVPTNTSGDFAALSGTDGYVELDADTEHFARGRIVPFHGWDAA